MSWYLAVPEAVDVAVILCLALLFPSVINADVPHSSSKEPLLNEISEPLVMALIMCYSTCSFGWYYGSHVWCSTCGCLDELVRPVPKHLTVQLLTLYVLVFSESVRGEGIEFYSVLMKRRWFVLPYFISSGLKAVHPCDFFLIWVLGRESRPIMLSLGVSMVRAVFVYMVLGFFSACILSVGPLAIFPRYFG